MEKIALASERGKRFIVFKPEIERTRWKEGREKGRIRKGKWFSRRGESETAAKSEIEGRR